MKKYFIVIGVVLGFHSMVMAMPDIGYLKFQVPSIKNIDLSNTATRQTLEIIRLLPSGEEISVLQKNNFRPDSIALVSGNFKIKLSGIESSVFAIQKNTNTTLWLGYFYVYDFKREVATSLTVLDSHGQTITFEQGYNNEIALNQTNRAYYVLPGDYTAFVNGRQMNATITVDHPSALLKPTGGIAFNYLGSPNDSYALFGDTNYVQALARSGSFNVRSCFTLLIDSFLPLPEGAYDVYLNGIHSQAFIPDMFTSTPLKTGRLKIIAPQNLEYQITNSLGEKVKKIDSCYGADDMSRPNDLLKGENAFELFPGLYTLFIYGDRISFLVEEGKIHTEIVR